MSKTNAQLEELVKKLKTIKNKLVSENEKLEGENMKLTVALETAEAGNDAEIPEHGSNDKLSKKARQEQLQAE